MEMNWALMIMFAFLSKKYMCTLVIYDTALTLSPLRDCALFSPDVF